MSYIAIATMIILSLGSARRPNPRGMMGVAISGPMTRDPGFGAPNPKGGVVGGRHQNLGVHGVPGDTVDSVGVARQFGDGVFSQDVVDVDFGRIPPIFVFTSGGDKGVVTSASEAAVDGEVALGRTRELSYKALVFNAP